jgi:hypothetical protein
MQAGDITADELLDAQWREQMGEHPPTAHPQAGRPVEVSEGVGDEQVMQSMYMSMTHETSVTHKKIAPPQGEREPIGVKSQVRHMPDNTVHLLPRRYRCLDPDRLRSVMLMGMTTALGQLHGADAGQVAGLAYALDRLLSDLEDEPNSAP